MSVTENDALMERVNEAIEYWTDTAIAKKLTWDLAQHDLEQLYADLIEAEGLAAQEEFNAYSLMECRNCGQECGSDLCNQCIEDLYGGDE